MRDNLVCDGAVVLEDVEVNCTSGFGDLLCDGLFDELVSSNFQR
jgi:hypothetical protein